MSVLTPPKSFRKYGYLFALLTMQGVTSLWAAADLTTTDGKQFKTVKILSEDAEKVRISHSEGISSIPKSVIPSEYLLAHDLTPGAASSPSAAAEDPAAKIRAFAAQFPTFKTRDEREFSSSDIKSIEPDAVKLMTSSGIVRVKITDLPDKYKMALGYDPQKAAEHERMKAEDAVLAKVRQQKLEMCSSYVDNHTHRVAASLRQKVGLGWMCFGEKLMTVNVLEETSRAGSPLSGPKVIVETQVKQRTAAVEEFSNAWIFGLSTGQQGQTWEGMIYGAGTGRIADLTANVYYTDRTTAINIMMQSDLFPATINSQGLPEGRVVVTTTEKQEVHGTGTGFAISADGYIATAHHVVAGAKEIMVQIGDKAVPAKVMASDEETDLAILKVDSVTQAIMLASPELPALGTELFAIGFPLVDLIGASHKYTQGNYSGINGPESEHTGEIQVSVPLQNGNSGGPVCTMDGRVVGVVRSILKNTEGHLSQRVTVQNVNFATHIQKLYRLLPKVPGVKLLPAPPLGDPKVAVQNGTYLIRVVSVE